MMNMACSGHWLMYHNTKLLGLPWTRLMNVWHPGLKKRLALLSECQTYGQIRVHMLDAYKNNKSYFFAEVFALHLVDEELSKIKGRPVWVEVFNRPMPCFFLGSYPVYWVLDAKGFGYASDTVMGKRWAIGLEPFIPNVDMGLFRDIAEDRWDLYLKPDVIETYRAQKQRLFERKRWQQLCLEKNYPPEVKKPSRTTRTPRGPGTIETPWTELKPPPVEMPAQPAEAMPPRMWIEFSDLAPDRWQCKIWYPSAPEEE